MKGWFYPASRYGHEFIYPESQARQIAQRTRTLVLSADLQGSGGKGTLHLLDETGARSAWKGDGAMIAEWETWQSGRSSTPASANLVGQFEGRRVTLDELEENPTTYLNQKISVDAEIESVFGPRSRGPRGGRRRAGGRKVHLTGQKITARSNDGGFFVGSERLYVLLRPADASGSDVKVGDTVTLNGVVMELPSGMHDRLGAPGAINEDIYIYATTIS